jgi:malonyl-CoA O-methyltransferase
MYPPWPHNPLMLAEQAVVAPIIASTRPLRALDVGTGSGRYLPLLASTGARVVAGVDFSLPMLTIGREATGRLETAHRICGDASRLPFRDASFDLVVSSLMVGDIADLAGWADELARVLVPCGHLIYSDFHPVWAARGWRRTFQTADGRSFEIAYFPHTIEEHRAVLMERSFDLRAIHEPSLVPPDEVARSDRSGRRGSPVAVVFHAVKDGRVRPSFAPRRG